MPRASPDSKFIKELESLLFKFIWGDKPDKINRKLLIQDYKDGGLRMTDIITFIKGLKITWFRRMFQKVRTTDWQTLFEDVHQTTIDLILTRGDNYTYEISKNSHNIFWKEAILYLSELHKIVLNESSEDIMDAPLWYNSNIRIDNKPTFMKKWNDKNILNIQDLITTNGLFLSYEQFCNKYNFQTPFTTFIGIKLAILDKYPYIGNIPFDPLRPSLPKLAKLLLYNQKGSRVFYDIFLNESKNTCKKNYESKWTITLNQARIRWKDIYISNFHFSKENRLLWFQYRMTHRILATNELLYKYRIKSDPFCEYCKHETETLEHLFFYCEQVHKLWTDLTKLIRDETRFEITITANSVLLLNNKMKCAASNLIIVLTKIYIYRKRFLDMRLHINELKKEIAYYCELEKYQHSIKGEYNIFIKRWNPLQTLFLNI